MPLKKFFKISLSTNCFLSLMLFSLRYPPLCFRSPFFLLPYFSPALKTSTYWKPYHTLFFSPDPPCFLTLQNISRPTTLTLPKTLSQLLSLFPVFLQRPLSYKPTTSLSVLPPAGFFFSQLTPALLLKPPPRQSGHVHCYASHAGLPGSRPLRSNNKLPSLLGVVKKRKKNFWSTKGSTNMPLFNRVHNCMEYEH